MGASALTPEQARRIYDRIGRWQDTQAFYEHRATDELIRLARLGEAHAVLELGCGTGGFAARLLAEALPADARYLGIDVSPVMVRLATERLRPWTERAEVRQSDGSLQLPADAGTVDRVVSTYVLDLLSPADTHAFLAEARRVLAPGGLVCLTSLSAEASGAASAVVAAWSRLWQRSPRLVGGCRPIRAASYLEAARWTVAGRRIVSSFGVPSEVVVARPPL